MKSKMITLSAISASLIAISLSLGVYIELFDLLSLVIASAFIIIPLYFKQNVYSFLAYLAGGILAVIFSAFNFVYSVVLPAYFIFFGLFPIIMTIIEEKVKWGKLALILGLIWCVVVFYGMFFYYSFVMDIDFFDLPDYVPLFIKNNIVYFISVIAVVFYFIFIKYIKVLKKFIWGYLDKIVK